MNPIRILLECIKFYRDRNEARLIIASSKLPRHEHDLYSRGADALFLEFQEFTPSDGHLVAANEAWRKNNVVGLRALVKWYYATFVSSKGKATA